MPEAFGLTIPTRLADVCDPSRLALIVYDMQVGIVDQIATGREILARTKRLVDAARAGGYRIFFTRHVSLPNRLAGIGALRRAMIWQHNDDPEQLAVPFHPNAPTTAIVPELEPSPDEVVIDKITMSCFAGTYLDIALRDAKLEAFAIAGIALEIGIEPSVRHGCDLNYVPVVVADACGYADEAAYRRALEGFAFTGEAIVTDTATLAPVLATPAR